MNQDYLVYSGFMNLIPKRLEKNVLIEIMN